MYMILNMRIIASVFGAVAVIISSIHEFYEIEQGKVATPCVYINSIGVTECGPNCLPAITIMPNSLVVGIASIIVSIIMGSWIIIRLNDKAGGIGFILLLTILLRTGDGYLAQILGFIRGVLRIRSR